MGPYGAPCCLCLSDGMAERVIRMIGFLAGSAQPDVPDVIERDGRTYRRRVVAAYAVREGDLTSFYDCTGAPGTVGTYATGRVWLVMKYTPRQSPAPWRRTELHMTDWQGTMRSWMLPSRALEYAPRDRVEIWRESAS